MNILYLKGEINDNSIDDFIKEYNKCSKDNPITIYINSCGGDVGHADIILNIINQNSKNITLIASGEIFSAAFNIFFFSKCKRIILEDCIGMAHFSWATFQLDETGKPSSEYDKFLMDEMKRNKSYTIKRFQSIGLNSRELNKIKNSKDCFFTVERLKELLNYGQKGTNRKSNSLRG